MKDYRRIYREFFNVAEQDIVLSELSGSLAHDIHHIEAKQMGGRPLRSPDGNLWCDRIENLIAISRKEHDDIHNEVSQYTTEKLKMTHQRKIDFVRKYNPFGWRSGDPRLFPTVPPEDLKYENGN